MTKTLTLEEHAARVRLVRETFPYPSRVLGGDVDISTDHVHEAFAAAMVRVRELEAALEETRELAEEGRLSAADRGVAMVAAEAWRAETIARFSEVFGEPVVVPPVGSEFGPKNEYEVRVFEREAIVARVLSIVARAEKAEAELTRGRVKLAENEAKLTRVREAVEELLRWSDHAEGCAGLYQSAEDHLRAALTAAGPTPTLAEIRAEALEEAAERVEAAAAGMWITAEAASALIRRQRADDLAMNAAERRVLRTEKAAKGGDRG